MVLFPWRAIYFYVYILTLRGCLLCACSGLRRLDADLIRAGDYEATKAKLLSKLTDDDAWN